MKTPQKHREEIASIFEANRREYVAQRIADLTAPSMHTYALVIR